MCHGLAAAHPELEFVEKFKVVKKKEINRNKVTLISGGGSGHEPAHAGFVGKGMLDAAVCGDVFASPSQIQVYEAIKATASDKGTLLIIKNYSGDCMNFNNAGARAKEDDDINVDAVFVNDAISSPFLSWMTALSLTRATIFSASSSEVTNFSVATPGSPWIPTPNSMFSSASSKIGVPFAGGVQEEIAKPILATLSMTF